MDEEKSLSVIWIVFLTACTSVPLDAQPQWKSTLRQQVLQSTDVTLGASPALYFEKTYSKRVLQLWESFLQKFPAHASLPSFKWRVVRHLDASWGLYDSKERVFYMPLGLFQAFFYEHEWLLCLEFFALLCESLEPSDGQKRIDLCVLAASLENETLLPWFQAVSQRSILHLHQAGKEVRGIESVFRVLEKSQPRLRRIPHQIFESLSQSMQVYIKEHIPVRKPHLVVDSDFFEIQGILKEWDLQYEPS